MQPSSAGMTENLDDGPHDLVEDEEAATRPRGLLRESGPFYRFGLPLIGLALFAGIWEIVGRFWVTNRLLFAPMSSTVVELYHLIVSGQIGPDLAVSGKEFIIGYLVAAVLGLALGALFAASSFISRLMVGVVQAGYATPLVAIAPVIIVLFGIGIESKVIVVAAMAIFPILIGTEGALRWVNPEYRDTARAFGANRLQVLAKVVFPAAAPGVMTGLRLGVGRGIIGVVVAEFFGSSQGLGFLLLNDSNEFLATQVLAVVVLLAFIGIVTNSLLLMLENRLSPWNRRGSGRQS
jgi:NitT/TauT family transport system permease protein